MNELTLSYLSHGITPQWKKDYNHAYYMANKEKWARYLEKVKGSDYAKKKNKEQREIMLNRYANTAGEHKQNVQTYIKALKLLDRHSRRPRRSDEEYYKQAMRGLKKTQVKEMNRTRKEINQEIRKTYKNEIRDVYDSIKMVKMSDLGEQEKSLCIMAGKSAMKGLIKGYVSNMVVNNLVGVGLMVERILNQEYH